MKRSYIGLALGALVVVGAMLSLPSCGHDQKLVSVTVSPSAATIAGPGIEVDFKAVGTYIHPPESRDITTSVVPPATARPARSPPTRRGAPAALAASAAPEISLRVAVAVVAAASAATAQSSMPV